METDGAYEGTYIEQKSVCEWTSQTRNCTFPWKEWLSVTHFRQVAFSLFDRKPDIFFKKIFILSWSDHIITTSIQCPLINKWIIRPPVPYQNPIFYPRPSFYCWLSISHRTFNRWPGRRYAQRADGWNNPRISRAIIADADSSLTASPGLVKPIDLASFVHLDGRSVRWDPWVGRSEPFKREPWWRHLDLE